MATDISWALKAIKMIYYRHEYDAAFEEFGLARVRFLNQVIQLAVENRNYRSPTSPAGSTSSPSFSKATNRNSAPWAVLYQTPPLRPSP
jgi:hypothetical protein